MNRITLLILLICIYATGIYSQSSEIEQLKQLKKSVSTQIEQLEDSLNNINTKINYLESKLYSDSEDAIPFEATIKFRARILDAPASYADIVTYGEAGEKLYIFNYAKKGYWICQYDGKEGYINDMYFDLTPNAEYRKSIVEDSIKVAEAEAKIVRDSLRVVRDSLKKVEEANALKAKRVELTKKFGSEIADRIMNRKIWLGMTTEMARLSIGNPSDINRSVYSFGVHEQWVYSSLDLYLYFEDGKLTSWQD